MTKLERLFDAAGGVCTYCGCATYVGTREPAEAALVRFGIPAGGARCPQMLVYRHASRERLVRGVDGGTYAPGNVALSCTFCNTNRGGASPEQHRAAMARLIEAGHHPNHRAELKSTSKAFKKARWQRWLFSGVKTHRYLPVAA